MLNVHIVTWQDRFAYQSQLERYFRLRHEIYVVNRKWREIARPIPIEMDAFDNEDAIYLLGISADGEVIAGSRLVPSMKPHLLSEIFPMLSNSGIPRSPTTFEWTRIFIEPRLRTPGAMSTTAAEILAGLLKASLHLQIDQISVVCETYWRDRFLKIGWEFQQLGSELDHPDGKIIALLIKVRRETLSRTYAYCGIDAVQLTPPRRH